jgi:hypothetical protein
MPVYLFQPQVNTDKTEFFTAEFAEVAEKNFSGFTIIVSSAVPQALLQEWLCHPRSLR